MIGRRNASQIDEEEKPIGFDSYDLRLGDLMRGERATLGNSLLDVQRELKIKASYIAAIENADVSAFESQGFIAGYVRSYARYLGIDPEWAFTSFCEESGFVTAHGLAAGASSQTVSPENSNSAPEHSGDPLSNPNAKWVPKKENIFSTVEPGALGSITVLAALICALGFGGWSILQEIQRVDFAPVEHTPNVLVELPNIGAIGAATGSNDTEQVADAGAGLTTPPSADALDRLYRPQALDIPVLTHRDAPISTLDPRNVGVLADVQTGSIGADVNLVSADGLLLASDSVNSVEPVVQVFGADAAEVSVFAVRPSWIQIKAADNTVIFEKILDAGEHYVLPKTEQAPILRAGNAGSVYFAVNGAAYGPAGSGTSVVKNVELSQDALLESYAVADMDNDSDLATYLVELQPQQ